ncbi:MAG: hypothetical protein ACE5NA_11900 [Nitrospiraceae bacterium]
MKNPGVAAVLSFFITGLGQIYNGQILKGLLCVLAVAICGVLTMIIVGWFLLIPLWIWGIFDACRTAERFNAAARP